MLVIEKVITNEMVEEKIKQLKPIHPELAAAISSNRLKVLEILVRRV